MVKRKINLIGGGVLKLDIPETAEDMSIAEYQLIIQNMDKSEDPTPEEVRSGLYKVLMGYFNISLKEVEVISMNDVLDLVRLVTIALADMKNKIVVPMFELEDVRYAIDPDFENMSLGEFVDLSEYAKNIKDLHKMVAVMYRPVTKEVSSMIMRGLNQWEIEPYTGINGREELFESLPANVGMGLTFFFRSSLIDLMRISNRYLMEEGEKMTTQLEETSLTRNMDGSTQSID